MIQSNTNYNQYLLILQQLTILTMKLNNKYIQLVFRIYGIEKCRVPKHNLKNLKNTRVLTVEKTEIRILVWSGC